MVKEPVWSRSFSSKGNCECWKYGGSMKKDIHPNYEEAKIKCACGNEINTRSTVKEMHVNTCSACHPFFTGQAKYIDTEGRVERFQKRYAHLKINKK